MQLTTEPRYDRVSRSNRPWTPTMPKADDITTPDSPPANRPTPVGASDLPAARGETAPVPSPGERERGVKRSPRARGNGRSASPAELRREIERTRARMSSTLDAIEHRIVDERRSLERKKDEMVDRATLKPIRERLAREPWRTMAIAFVAGYVVAAIRD